MTRAILVSFILLAAQAAAGDNYLFAYFKDSGKSGVFYALSKDGYQWHTVKNGEAMLKPEKADELMRDPHIAKGPDGEYHMVWTWDWKKTTLGHAHSKDLVHWSEHQEIPIMTNISGVKNVWAPEIYWDKQKKHWLIIWSSTVEGRFPETAGQVISGGNHRIYSTTTADFTIFSDPKVFSDPGYPVIDGTILQVGAKFRLLFKDERDTPVKKTILFATGPSLEGPWTGISEPFTESWAEGPSAIKIDGVYLVYYDRYRKPQQYRAIATRDWKKWEDVTNLMILPSGARHGAFIKITSEDAKAIGK
jgi:hypothetical protein